MKQVVLISSCLFAASLGCKLLSEPRGIKPADISEIHTKMQTGLAGVSADFVVRRDGAAELECNFYRTDEEALKQDSMTLNAIVACGNRYKNAPASFKKTKNQFGSDFVRGTSNATASAEQFSRLAELIVRNEYFSMDDRYEVPGLMDAPPDITRVVYKGGEKTVSNQGDKGGPKLAEIEQAVHAVLNELDWN